MPPKGAKRKYKEAAGDDDDLWDVPGDQPTKRTRTSRSRTSGLHIGEHSENAGKKDTRQSHSWAEWQKKFNDKEKDDKRQFAGTFKHNIEKNRENIQQYISNSTESLKAAAKKDTELFQNTCNDIEAATTSTPISEDGSPKTRQDSSLFKAGQELFSRCRDLVAVHEQANGKASAQANLHTNEMCTLWKADMEQARKAVMYSAQYGEKIIRCHVDMANDENTKIKSLTPPRNVLDGPGQMAIDMHQKSIEKLTRGQSTWGGEALEFMDKFAGIAVICESQADGV